MTTEVEKLLYDAGRSAPPTGIDLSQAISRGRASRRLHRRARVGVAALALVAGAGFALTGLTRTDDDPPAGNTPAASSADRTADPVLTAREDWALQQARITAVVRREGDCLLLDSRLGSHIVIWPRGTRWSATDETVVFPNGMRLGLGDTVVAGGGYLPLGGMRLDGLLNSRSIDHAKRCSQQNQAELMLFNPGVGGK